MSAPADEEETLCGDLFLNLSTREERFVFGEGACERTLVLEVSTAACTDFDLTGQLAWPGARLLCRWLSLQPAGFFSRALELGSGTGLSGILYSARGGDVTLTDYQPVVLDLLARNAARAHGTAAVAPLLWGDQHHHAALLTLSGGYPCLLGADIVYPGSQSYLPALMRSVNALLAPKGVFVLCYCSRSRVTDAALFLAMHQAGLAWRVAEGGESAPEGGVSGTVYLVTQTLAQM